MHDDSSMMLEFRSCSGIFHDVSAVPNFALLGVPHSLIGPKIKGLFWASPEVLWHDCETPRRRRVVLLVACGLAVLGDHVRMRWPCCRTWKTIVLHVLCSFWDKLRSQRRHGRSALASAFACCLYWVLQSVRSVFIPFCAVYAGREGSLLTPTSSRSSFAWLARKHEHGMRSR